jgi:anti-sigma regulatory factor (Ser/Thr protein kinase)
MTEDLATDRGTATRRWDSLALADLAPIRAFIRETTHSDGANDEAVGDLVQAVDELVCNVIEHGYGQGVTGPVEVRVQHDAARIVITIVDSAPPFDPTGHPTPDLTLPLEQRPFGGMGVHLARTLTDGMRHRILPGGGNEVTLEKRI